jgi:aryl-alcohol dehydrogenase-like predicted oxidoreductase
LPQAHQKRRGSGVKADESNRQSLPGAAPFGKGRRLQSQIKESAEMEKRALGNQGLTVSAQGLGCMGMSEFYGAIDDQESIATMHRALELGVNFFDTSDAYGPYTNEELVGKAFADRRDKALIATKFGITRSGENYSVRGIDGRPEYVRAACDASLKRLGSDYIDLYYQHRVDANVPIEETIGAMAELVRAGKVRYLGLSEAGAQTIRRAHAVHPISALQTEYSLWSRECEDEILPTVRQLGIGFVAYSPLGRGFLTGQFKSIDDFEADDYRRYSPRFQGENFQKNLELLDRITALAEARGVTSSQLALAWVISRGKDVIPIAGTKRRKYLEENIAASEIVLSAAELADLEAAFPKDAAQGTRYPAAMMGSINR